MIGLHLLISRVLFVRLSLYTEKDESRERVNQVTVVPIWKSVLLVFIHTVRVFHFQYADWYEDAIYALAIKGRLKGWLCCYIRQQ